MFITQGDYFWLEQTRGTELPLQLDVSILKYISIYIGIHTLI